MPIRESTPTTSYAMSTTPPVIEDRWCPGNGTVYDLLLMQPGGRAAVFVWLNGPARIRASMRIHDGEGVDVEYLMEKMNLRETDEPDAAALLAWLAQRGVGCRIPDGYDVNGVQLPMGSR